MAQRRARRPDVFPPTNECSLPRRAVFSLYLRVCVMVVLLLDETVSTDVWLSKRVGGPSQRRVHWGWLPHRTTTCRRLPADEEISMAASKRREDRRDDAAQEKLNVVIACHTAPQVRFRSIQGSPLLLGRTKSAMLSFRESS